MASDFFTTITGMQDYLAYATIGFAFNSFIFSVAFGGSNAIRGEQQEGTAELVFLTPANKFAWILGKTVGNLCFSLITFFTILFLGIIFFGFRPTTAPNFPLTFLGILLTLIALTAFSFVYAGVCFFAKREEELSQVLWPMMVFFSGLAFPVEILPQWAQLISWLIPLTHGLNITRRALLLGVCFSDPSVILGLEILVLQTIILMPTGFLLFSKLEKSVRKSGALATY